MSENKKPDSSEEIITYDNHQVSKKEGLILLDLENFLMKHNQTNDTKPNNFRVTIFNSHVYELHLYNQNLELFPIQVLSLPFLRTLELSHNKLKEIPESIENLTNLESLDLHNNRLMFLPENIRKLSKLKSLNCESNQIAKISNDCIQLQALEELNLNQNNFELFNNTWISSLLNLKTLKLCANNITEIPDSFRNLSHLTSLYIGKNKIKTVSEWIGLLKNLNKLDLSDNRLELFPNTIKSLTLLNEINLDNNQFKKFPFELTQMPSLYKITLNGNLLTTIPQELKNLKRLTYFSCKKNLFQTIPTFLREMAGIKKFQIESDKMDQYSLLKWYCKISRFDNDEINRSHLDREIDSLPLPEVKLLIQIVEELQNSHAEFPFRIMNGHVINLHLNAFEYPKLEEFEVFANLESLIWENSILRTMPNFLQKLPHLKTLILTFDEINEIPVWFQYLNNLEYLDLGQNYLKFDTIVNIPSSIRKLGNIFKTAPKNDESLLEPYEIPSNWLNLPIDEYHVIIWILLQCNAINNDSIEIEKGHVRKIKLTDENGTFDISPELCKLPYLEYLQLDCGDGFHKLPEFVSTLSNLKVLIMKAFLYPDEKIKSIENVETFSCYIENDELIIELLLLFPNLRRFNAWPRGNNFEEIKWKLFSEDTDQLNPPEKSALRVLQYFECLEKYEIENKLVFGLIFKKLKCRSRWEYEDEFDILNYLIEKFSKIFTAFTNLKYLSIESRRLKQIPMSFNANHDLEELDLSDNILTDISDLGTWFPNLRVLNMSSNEIEMIPNNLGNLTKLTHINLKNNGIRQLPESFSNLIQLEDLILAENSLTIIPEYLNPLNRLKKIDISYNLLSDLPDWMFRLKKLQEIYILVNKWSNFFIKHILNQSENENFRQVEPPNIIQNWSNIEKTIHRYHDFFPLIIEKIKKNIPLDQFDKEFPNYRQFANQIKDICTRENTPTAIEILLIINRL